MKRGQEIGQCQWTVTRVTVTWAWSTGDNQLKYPEKQHTVVYQVAIKASLISFSFTAPHRRSASDEHVCSLSVSLSARISINDMSKLHKLKLTVHVICGRSSVLLWPQCNMSGTFGFCRPRYVFTLWGKYRLGVCNVANYSPWLVRWRH